MRIGIINTTFNEGSTGYLSKKLFEYVNLTDECFFFYGIGKKEKQKNVIKIQNAFGTKVHNFLSRLFGLQGFFSTLSSYKITSFIKKNNISHVFLGNLHGNYLNYNCLLKRMAKMGVKCVQIMWDEFSFTGKCAFSYSCTKYTDKCFKCEHLHDYPNSWFFDRSSFIQQKKKHLYSNLDVVFVGTPFTSKRSEESWSLRNKTIYSFDEAVDQTIFKPTPVNDELLKMLNISNDKIVILNVSSYPDKRKGGDYFVKLAKRFENDDRFVFVHVGVKEGIYNFPKNYRPISFIKNKLLLSDYYNISDLFVCTSIAETQPNACLEALSCGLRICGFNISSIPSCAPDPIGKYFDLGDVDSIGDYITSLKKKDPQTIELVCDYSRPRYDISHYCCKLMEIIKKI